MIGEKAADLIKATEPISEQERQRNQTRSLVKPYGDLSLPERGR
jgi:hypothetical protein